MNKPLIQTADLKNVLPNQDGAKGGDGEAKDSKVDRDTLRGTPNQKPFAHGGTSESDSESEVKFTKEQTEKLFQQRLKKEKAETREAEGNAFLLTSVGAMMCMGVLSITLLAARSLSGRK